MISKQAVSQYLNSHVRDLALLKRTSRRELELELSFLEPVPVFHTKPRIDQLIGFLAAVHYKQIMFNYDMGTGKSKMVLDVIRHLLRAGKARRALILVPLAVLVDSWEEQCATHAPDLNCRFLKGDRAEKLADLKSDCDVCVITYQGWIRFVTQKGKKPGLVLDAALADELGKLFNVLVMDECTAVMNHRSLQFKACKRMLRFCEYRYGMTGTPFGRDLQALWGQFFCVDGGQALSTTLGMYRQAFFTEKKGYFGGFEYTFDHKKISLLKQRMRHSCIRYGIEECYELPSRTYIKQPIIFSDEAWEYYKAVVKRAREVQGFDELSNIFISMRQISSGFAKVGDQYIDFSPNQKLDWLMELLRNIGDEKVVVFNEFIHSGDLISSRLLTGKIRHSRLYSGTKDRGKELHRFQHDPKCQIMLLNSQSGAMGLNLQVARYVVFYESPVDPKMRDQAERRIWRVGQLQPVFYYDLFVRGSVEEKILTYLRQGKDLFNEVINHLATLTEEA